MKASLTNQRAICLLSPLTTFTHQVFRKMKFFVKIEVCCLQIFSLTSYSYRFMCTFFNRYSSFYPNWVSASAYLYRDSEGIKKFDLETNTSVIVADNEFYVGSRSYLLIYFSRLGW